MCSNALNYNLSWMGFPPILPLFIMSLFNTISRGFLLPLKNVLQNDCSLINGKSITSFELQASLFICFMYTSLDS